MSYFSKFVKVLQKHLFVYMVSFIVISIGISSSLILKFEAPYPDSQIKTVNDAIWWSAVGLSTIGIGNVVPESPQGRYLTLFLMIVGLVVFSIITAKIAAVFTEEEVREDLQKDMKIIEGDLNRVEHNIEGEVAVDDKKIEDQVKILEVKMDKLEKGK